MPLARAIDFFRINSGRRGFSVVGGGRRFLSGEDTCNDEGDFTVDFDDGGMLGNHNDGTDWGEADGTFKCGRIVQIGQRFIFARERVQP